MGKGKRLKEARRKQPPQRSSLDLLHEFVI